MVQKCFYGESADVFPGVIARNKVAQDYENFIHSTIYPNIIHPYSFFRVYWEIAQLAFGLLQLVFFFTFWALMMHDNFFYQLFLNFSMAIHFTDLVLMFFTGYVESETEIVILDPKRIARRYLLRTFILDLLGSIPVELFMYFIKRQYIAVNLMMISHSYNYVVYVSVFQVFLRFATYIRYLRNTSKVFLWNPFIVSLISIVTPFSLLIHLYLTLIFFSINLNDVSFILEPYFQDFFLFMKLLMELPLGFYVQKLDGHKNWYWIIRIPMLILSFFFTAYLTAYFLMYTRVTAKTNERFYVLENNVRSFARKNQLSTSLKQKTSLYLKVFSHSKHYQDDEMYNYFPDTFKSEIAYISLPLLKAFYVFENLPIYVLRRLAECLHYQLYLPNEMIMMKGETKLRMYFIQSGTVALYSERSTELYHFQDGCCFNGKHFIDGKLPSNHYAISIEVTEMYRLDHDDFMGIMAAYPRLLQKIKQRLYRDITDRDYQTLID